MVSDLLRDRPRLARLLARGARRVLAAAEPGQPSNGQGPERADPAPAGDGTTASPSPGASAPREAADLPPGVAQVFRPVPGAGALYARTADISWLANEGFACTSRLYERLSELEVQEIEAMIDADPELRETWEVRPDPGSRKVTVLAYGIWLGHPAATAATGLRAVRPPADIHNIGGGPLAAAGGLYEADILANSLTGIGIDPATLGDGLDFGCSSGRVVRVLAAAYPEVRWRACDPNEAAIAWASECLPGIDFFISPTAPPLELPDGSLDVAFANSIWSHFAPQQALRWFAEMHRLIRPGGHLIFTTHGSTSVGYLATRRMRSAHQCDEIVADLYRRGWWYAAEFGERGDWGVSDPEWGNSFYSPEWILGELCPRWRVVEFAPGRNQYNQDVYVMRRN